MYGRLSFAIGLLAAGACTPPGRTAPAAAEYSPTFAFAPPASAAPGSAGVTFAIVNASYSSREAWTQTPLFGSFSAHLSSDFQQVLSARGFTTRGPYRSYDEMTYPDRQSTDLTLQPILEVTFAAGNLTAHSKFQLIGPNTCRLSGTLTVAGRVTLAINESLSNERMWFRSIDIARPPVPWEGTLEYAEVQRGSCPMEDPLSDPGFKNVLARELEQTYRQVMQASWNYMDPGEMSVVKRQSLDVRGRWVATSRPH